MYGFAQYRESEGDTWRFYIRGFDSTTGGHAGFCTIETGDGKEETVAIDEQDRLLIVGKRYGRDHWDH